MEVPDDLSVFYQVNFTAVPICFDKLERLPIHHPICNPGMYMYEAEN